MNFAAVLMVTDAPTKEMIITAYAAGFPVDLVHSASSAVFMWLISEPMIDKLERVKIKYGIAEASE